MDLSVVIPARDVESTLGEQLDALLAEEWDGEWEIVVVDNRSSDGTAALVREYAAKSAGIPVRLALAADRVRPQLRAQRRLRSRRIGEDRRL